MFLFVFLIYVNKLKMVNFPLPVDENELESTVV